MSSECHGWSRSATLKIARLFAVSYAHVQVSSPRLSRCQLHAEMFLPRNSVRCLSHRVAQSPTPVLGSTAVLGGTDHDSAAAHCLIIAVPGSVSLHIAVGGAGTQLYRATLTCLVSGDRLSDLQYWTLGPVCPCRTGGSPQSCAERRKGDVAATISRLVWPSNCCSWNVSPSPRVRNRVANVCLSRCGMKPGIPCLNAGAANHLLQRTQESSFARWR